MIVALREVAALQTLAGTHTGWASSALGHVISFCPPFECLVYFASHRCEPLRLLVELRYRLSLR